MGEAGGGVRPSPVVVGRAELLSLARRRWQAAGAGEGQLLLLAGEAGIGKTRLLRHVAQSVRAEGSVVVVAAAPHRFPRRHRVALPFMGKDEIATWFCSPRVGAPLSWPFAKRTRRRGEPDLW